MMGNATARLRAPVRLWHIGAAVAHAGSVHKP